MEQNLPDSFDSPVRLELNVKNDAAPSVFAWMSGSVWRRLTSLTSPLNLLPLEFIDFLLGFKVQRDYFYTQ